jgi:hypothetical protein
MTASSAAGSGTLEQRFAAHLTTNANRSLQDELFQLAIDRVHTGAKNEKGWQAYLSDILNHQSKDDLLQKIEQGIHRNDKKTSTTKTVLKNSGYWVVQALERFKGALDVLAQICSSIAPSGL